MISSDPATIKDFEIVFQNIVSVLMSAGALGLFAMLIISGFKYLSSGGDAKVLEAAKKTFTYAIGGFVVLAASYLILRFIGIFTGTDSVIKELKLLKNPVVR